MQLDVSYFSKSLEIKDLVELVKVTSWVWVKAQVPWFGYFFSRWFLNPTVFFQDGSLVNCKGLNNPFTHISILFLFACQLKKDYELSNM